MEPDTVEVLMKYIYSGQIGTLGLVERCYSLLVTGAVAAEEAVGVLVVNDNLGMEDMVEAAVERINGGRERLVREPRFRERPC